MHPSQLPPQLSSKIEILSNGCWHWTRSTNGHGYGQVKYQGRVRKVHRLVFELLTGAPPATDLDHTCHDPDRCAPGVDCPHRRCCNPAHVVESTKVANVMRGGSRPAMNARKATCPDGHPFHVTPAGYRRCRQCDAESARRYRARRRTPPVPSCSRDGEV